MAGIGFKLQKYFAKGNDLVSIIQGSLYSVLLSTGPWLLTILTIGFISFFAQSSLNSKDVLLFKSIISYCYAFSLILFGVVEMPITRYLADKMFVKDLGPIKPIFSILLSLNALLTCLFCGGALLFSSLEFFTCLCICALFFSILCIWCSMIFLSAAKNYLRIVNSFIIGSALSGFLAWLLGDSMFLFGYLLGFTMGQMVLATLLVLFVYLEYNYADYFTMEVIDHFRKHRALALTGLLYYLGVWADKFVFWFSAEGLHIQDFFYTNLYYDTALFLAYLTIVPSMAVFLVLIETSFYRKLSSYFIAVENKENLFVIEKKVEQIVDSLKRTVMTMLKVQTFISVFIWYFADELLQIFNFPAKISVIFRYGVLGAYFQSLFLVLNIILLYFEAELIVLLNYLLFFLLSYILADITAAMDIRYWGLGYVVATFLVTLVTFRGVNLRIQNINFNVFMGQPLSTKNFYEKNV